MKTFLIDYKSENERRDWANMLGSDITEISMLRSIEPEFLRSISESVIVSHGYDWLPETDNDLASLSKLIEEGNVWIIFVSGGGGYPITLGKNFYYRRMGVDSVKGHIDYAFARCFGSFKEDLQRQIHSGAPISPNYSLLEPPAAPEALLSLYLCDVAGMILDAQQEAEMLVRAELEFNTLVDHEQLKPSGNQSWNEIQKNRAAGIGTLLKQLERKI